MDARQYYLRLHERAHFGNKAIALLDVPTEEQYRTAPPGHNSIIWILWHIASGEGWTVQTILQEREQLLTQDGWDTRLGIGEPGFGGGMARDDMVSISQQVHVDAVLDYYRAVAEATQEFATALDFDGLDSPIDMEVRLALVPQAAGPKEPMHERFARWTTPREWLDIMTVLDVAYHIEEADHVIRVLLPERDFDL